MASSTLLHESFRTGYPTMSVADLDQQSNQMLFNFNTFEEIINDAENGNLKWEDLMDDSSFDFDFNPSSIYRSLPLSPDSIFDIQAVEPFLYQALCSDLPSPFPPPPPMFNPQSNQHGLQDSVDPREDSLYRNIPTVVQGSVSEDDEEEEEDAAAGGATGYGQRHPLNASTHKCDKIRTSYTSAKTPAAAPRRVRRRKDQLWYFLLETLGNPKYNPHFIQWENKDLGIFRFIQSKKVAQLWGAKKNRSNMSYEYFARAMRHYYSRGIMHRVAGRRLVYQFGPKAENWKSYAQNVAISASSLSSSTSSPSSSPSCSSSTNANSISSTSSS